MRDYLWPAQNRFVGVSGGITTAIGNLAYIIFSIVILILYPAIKITRAHHQRDTIDFLQIKRARRAISPRIRTSCAAAIMGENGHKGAISKVALGLNLTRKVLLWARGVFVLDGTHGALRSRILCRDQHWQCPRASVTGNYGNSFVCVGRKSAVTVVHLHQLSPDRRIKRRPCVFYPLAVAGDYLAWITTGGDVVAIGQETSTPIGHPVYPDIVRVEFARDLFVGKRSYLSIRVHPITQGEIINGVLVVV